jgi:hypothetical protein
MDAFDIVGVPFPVTGTNEKIEGGLALITGDVADTFCVAPPPKAVAALLAERFGGLLSFRPAGLAGGRRGGGVHSALRAIPALRETA